MDYLHIGACIKLVQLKSWKLLKCYLKIDFIIGFISRAFTFCIARETFSAQSIIIKLAKTSKMAEIDEQTIESETKDDIFDAIKRYANLYLRWV